jgi:hypothetical protein
LEEGRYLALLVALFSFLAVELAVFSLIPFGAYLPNKKEETELQYLQYTCRMLCTCIGGMSEAELRKIGSFVDGY